jgi:type II secretory ATPase GspE/PulE/Tfp pilus assembly ATPase PilB-like protein
MSSSDADLMLSAAVRQRLQAQLCCVESPHFSWEKMGDPLGVSRRARINLDQMFVLIDGILPFEACLYYQVLPLFVEGNQLNLGMVSPDDSTAFEYVRRIISYLNYALVRCPITSEAHQSVLSTYLSHTAKSPRRTPNSYRPAIRSRQNETASDRVTLLLDDSNPNTDETLDLSVTPPEPTPEPVPALISPLPDLNIASNYSTSSVDTLASLPADELLQELFARVLASGIGRLYFEGGALHGRILWSQDGVLQSVIETLAIDSLQAVIDQLKGMAGLAVAPIEKAEQVEVEYSYQKGRVLLRFQFMLSPHGETATVQILRGAALKFYQQQQIAKLERDAMGIAKQLQVKLSEIRDRARAESGLAGARFEVLPNLNQLLQNMGQDLNDWVNPS